MKTPFYELAEKIGNDINENCWYIQTELMLLSDKRYSKFFEEYLSPSHSEVIKYLSKGWDNQFRILALLFADLLWQDEMKKK